MNKLIDTFKNSKSEIFKIFKADEHKETYLSDMRGVGWSIKNNSLSYDTEGYNTEDLDVIDIYKKDNLSMVVAIVVDSAVVFIFSNNRKEGFNEKVDTHNNR